MTLDSLQIVIPVYNEAENIARTLGQIKDKVATPHRISIVYDFDGDNTIAAVNQFIKKQNTKNIFLIKNRYGKGPSNAIRTGFDSTKNGAVLVVMADSSDDLSIVDSMFHKMNEGYDIVCGSRYMKGGSHLGGPRLKEFLSRMAGLSLHFMIRIPTHDITNSFKLYRKSVFDNLEIKSSRGFEIGMEIVIKAFLKGYRVTEIPSTWRERVAGKSRFRLLRWLPAYIRWYLYAIKERLKNTWRAQ